MSVTEPIQDKRVIRTLRLIEDAFLKVMIEKGFENLSVSDVTTQAGINRATFYAHFEDKFALLGHFIRVTFQHELERRGLRTLAWGKDALVELLATVLEYTSAVHAGCKPPHQHLDWLLETQVKKLVAEVLLVWLPQDESAAHTASWAMYSLVDRWMVEPKEKRASEFATENLGPILRLLGIESIRSG